VTPALSTIVVSWRSGADLERLVAAFPAGGVGERHELVVVDNAGEPGLERLERAGVRLEVPGANLGFAGGCNRGAARARAPLLLFLNPDAVPIDDALDRLLDGFERRRDAAGLVPRLLDESGAPQSAWQLRELPRAPALLAHAFFWNPGGARAEPAEGAPIGQPAAAALALRRSAFERVGGFDERFAPAWFEDVDLARRLAAAGSKLLYWPAARFRHRIGSSLPALGYGGFLRAYDRNLALYLRIHHGRLWELAFRGLVPIGALARLLALPLRRPRRAPSRRAAAAALLAAARGALDGWVERSPQ
jgi:GT2 family glycosyltransferase